MKIARTKAGMTNKREIISSKFMRRNVFHEIWTLLSRKVLREKRAGDCSRVQETEWVDALGFQYDQSPINANNLAEFDINDESTYGNVTVGKLAYELIKYVIENGNITDDEIETLKMMDGASSDINSSGYPILASNREDNKGGSNVTRYRKAPIDYKGADIFVSSQWKASDKSKLVAWFKSIKDRMEIRGSLPLLKYPLLSL